MTPRATILEKLPAEGQRLFRLLCNRRVPRPFLGDGVQIEAEERRTEKQSGHGKESPSGIARSSGRAGHRKRSLELRMTPYNKCEPQSAVRRPSARAGVERSFVGH